MSAFARLPSVLLALLALAAAAALGVAPAAGDGGAKTWIKISKLEPGIAKGKITSGQKSCTRKGRKVSLFRYEDFVSDKIAITYSKRGGRWRVRRSLEPGKYFAKVDSIKGCRYAVSPNKWL